MAFCCEKTEKKCDATETQSKHDANLKGTKTSRIAFSCTCHPNIKEAKPHNVNASTNDLYVAFLQSLVKKICYK